MIKNSFATTILALSFAFGANSFTASTPNLKIVFAQTTEDCFCPNGFSYDQPSRLCVSQQEAVGPFPSEMINRCRAFGGGPACDGSRWNVNLAPSLRGGGKCPLGANLDSGIGQCIEGESAYGPFPKAIVERCRSFGGGSACETMRLSKNFFLSSRANNYTPPPLSQRPLGTIPLAQAAVIRENFDGAKRILKLSGGQVYIDADMDTDADGSPRARVIDPCCGDPQTSLRYANGKSVNAEEVPYFALPDNNRDAAKRFYKRMGIKLGDIGAIIYKDKIEYAVFADVGPERKIGEGSIALHESLGRNPWTNSTRTRIVNAGIPKDVIYIVFPNSGNGTPQTVDKIRQKGRQLFMQIGGTP